MLVPSPHTRVMLHVSLLYRVFMPMEGRCRNLRWCSRVLFSQGEVRHMRSSCCAQRVWGWRWGLLRAWAVHGITATIAMSIQTAGVVAWHSQ